MPPETATTFDLLDDTLREAGPMAALDHLIAAMEDRDDPRSLLDALLLKARYDLGLPAVQPTSLADLPDPVRSRYEDRYVAAIRHVGGKLLHQGRIAQAWPYFRAIGEPASVALALDAFDPELGPDSLEDALDVAFQQGAHPARGYDLILNHYGVCSAITAFESLPMDESVRVRCAGRLVRTLHANLIASLRDEIRRHGDPEPPAKSTLPDLIAAHPWLFVDDAYHVDVSHLAAVVRLSPMLADPEGLELARELTEYGRNLSERHRDGGESPFDDLYADHAAYLGALLGRDVDTAIEQFHAKLPPVDPDGDGDTVPAQVLIRLLVRLDRIDEAIAISAEHLASVPESALGVPGLSQLCGRAGRLDRLAEAARAQGDLVRYAAAILPPHAGSENR